MSSSAPWKDDLYLLACLAPNVLSRIFTAHIRSSGLPVLSGLGFSGLGSTELGCSGLGSSAPGSSEPSQVPLG